MSDAHTCNTQVQRASGEALDSSHGLPATQKIITVVRDMTMMKQSLYGLCNLPVCIMCVCLSVCAALGDSLYSLHGYIYTVERELLGMRIILQST